MVPMSVVDDEFAEPTSLGSQVTPHLLSLPVAEANPVLRLHQVSYAFKAHKETGRAVRANKLAEIPGFAPDDVPRPRGAGGGAAPAALVQRADHQRARARSSRCTPRARGCWRATRCCRWCPGHALAIGVTSYDGKVFYGIDADRDAVPDVDVLGAMHGRGARRAGRCVVGDPGAGAARPGAAQEGRASPDARLPARAPSTTCAAACRWAVLDLRRPGIRGHAGLRATWRASATRRRSSR